MAVSASVRRLSRDLRRKRVFTRRLYELDILESRVLMTFSAVGTTVNAITGVDVASADPNWLATFMSDPGTTKADFTASIGWPTGSEAGSIVQDDDGTYHVEGSHTYTTSDAYSVSVTVTDTVDSTFATVNSTVLVAPPAPTNPALTFINSSFARLTWDPVATAARYKVFYSSDGVTFTCAGSTTAPTLDVTGLLPDTSYVFHIVALGPPDADAGNPHGVASAPASISGATGAGIAPATPLTIVNTAPDIFDQFTTTLSWTSTNSNILQQFIELREPGDSNWFTLLQLNTSAQTPAPQTLFSGTASISLIDSSFQVRVRIVTSTGESYSAPLAFRTPDFPTPNDAVAPDPAYPDRFIYGTFPTYGIYTTDTPEIQYFVRSDNSPFTQRWHGGNEVDFTIDELNLAGTDVYSSEFGIQDEDEYAVLAGNTTLALIISHDTTNGVINGAGSTLALGNPPPPLSGEVLTGSLVQDGDGNWNVNLYLDGTQITPDTISPNYIVAPVMPASGDIEPVWGEDYFPLNLTGHTMDRSSGYYAVAFWTGDTAKYLSMTNLVDVAKAFAPWWGRVTGVSDSSVMAEWDQAAYNETGYELEWSVDGKWVGDSGASTADGEMTVGPDLGQALISGLTQAGTYSFRVKAVRADATDGNDLDSAWYSIPGSLTLAGAVTVTGFQVNDGSAQRSSVTSVTVTFSEAVNLGDGAIAVTQRATGDAVRYTLSNPSRDGQTYVLTFTDPLDTYGSLPDGNYDVMIYANGVTGVSGASLDGDWSTSFFRLYGDVTGNGQVGDEDVAVVLANYGKSPATISDGDLSGNGTVDDPDVAIVLAEYGHSV